MYAVYREFEDMFGYDEELLGKFATKEEAENLCECYRLEEIEEFGEVIDVYYVEKEE